MKLLLTLAFSFLTFAQAAEVEVDDFGFAMRQMDDLYRNVSFKEALKCGEKAQFQAAKNMCTISCEPWGFATICQSLCIPPDVNSEFVNQEVVDCSDESATIFSSDGDIRVITKSDFEKYHHNPLREIFTQIPDWFAGVYKVTIYNARRGEHTLGWKTEHERKVGAWYIEGQIEYRMESGTEDFQQVIFTVIDDESIPWFARAARVRLTNEGTMWRLHDL